MKFFLSCVFTLTYLNASHAQLNAVQIGNNPNSFSCSEKSRSNVWYDQDVNSISFIHSGDPAVTGDANAGFYRYDVSKNGGAAWNVNRGPLYSNLNDKRGGYPLGVIVNPLFGNIIADSAYVAYNGPWRNSSGSRSGRVYGRGRIGAATHVQHYDSLSYACFPENMFVVKLTGDAWMVGNMLSNDSDNTYLDSIVVAHGIWNSATRDYDYTYRSLYVPVNPDVGIVVDEDIAFNDTGQVGYIAMITNNDPNYTLFPDSVLYLSVLKTVDGGINWFYANSNTNHPDIINVQLLDSLLLNNGTTTYGTAFDLDVVVDVNSNLHVLTCISPSRSFTVVGDDASGEWGMFDIFTNDGGSTWNGKLLDKPETFRGTFGDGSPANPLLNEDNRPFAGRSWDGTKLFFSWFDTDTVVYGTDPNFPKHNNKFPDLHTIGYDVNTQLWTDVMNLTQGTMADGSCTFGNGSYYMIDSALSGTVFSIPMVYQQLHSLDPVQTGLPTTFWYVQNANIDMTTATHPGNPLELGGFLKVQEISITHTITVSGNYPNPFSGKTSFDVQLTKASDVSVEVSNVLGQVLSCHNYSNIDSGSHTLAMDADRLSPGIYIYKVRAAGEVVAKKMIVQ